MTAVARLIAAAAFAALAITTAWRWRHAGLGDPAATTAIIHDLETRRTTPDNDDGGSGEAA